jgi:hypothetical protein
MNPQTIYEDRKISNAYQNNNQEREKFIHGQDKGWSFLAGKNESPD